ncbi:ATP-binding protein [Sphingosinicella sp. BN140058]|uniref:ATP-binding protein n=1 Tax=Sphingosinicella sp. BN140058 TaxID=1892855 RepID=UPI001012C75E|nr:ATP-binding protein [Sphingosinicella sp. BN140058]QAY80392.1 hypothetical protein ETR14_27515 [Sphingosinicella sp. BN140058]
MMSSVTQEELDRLLLGLGHSAMEIGADFSVRRLNELALKWDGRSASEILGQKLIAVWPDISRGKIGDAVREVMRSRVGQTVQATWKGSAGRALDVETAVVPWSDGLLLVSKDVSKRVRAERALEQASDRYRLATLAVEDMIYQWDIAADRLVWADRALSFLGLPLEERATTLDWFVERIHPEDRNRVATSLREALSGPGAVWTCDYRLRRGDGQWAQISEKCFFLREADGVASSGVGALTDVTGRREAEEEVARLQSELVHVARLSAMGTMASTLAHEMNQPLTAIMNYLGMSRQMLDKGDPANVPSVREGVGLAMESAERAGEIIRRLRRMVMKGRVSVETFSVATAVKEAVEFGLLGQRSIHAVQEVDADLKIEGDPVQLQQVLVNLVRNAAEAMNGQEDGSILVRATSREKIARIEVVDNGPGIAPEKKARLFEPFTSTKDTGMGIGLPISRTIIEAHGGQIWAESGVVRGTRFIIDIPKLANKRRQAPAVR